MNEQRFRVEGMTCTGCEDSLRRVLGVLPGVRAVHADHATGEVRLELEGESGPSHEVVKAAVDQAGFDLVD